MRLARSALLRRLLIALPASQFVTVAPPAHALIGEVTSAGFTQADDKSWDFTLPSPKWSVDGARAPRAEHPQRLFHVVGSGPGGASFDLTVVPGKARSASELGKVDAVGASLAATYGDLVSAEIVPGMVKGSKYYVMEFKSPSGGSTVVKMDAKQSRTYQLVVSLPKGPSAEVQAEAAALTSSFKCFPVNAFCIAQSNGGSSPASGSCY